MRIVSYNNSYISIEIAILFFWNPKTRKIHNISYTMTDATKAINDKITVDVFIFAV